MIDINGRRLFVLLVVVSLIGLSGCNAFGDETPTETVTDGFEPDTEVATDTENKPVTDSPTDTATSESVGTETSTETEDELIYSDGRDDDSGGSGGSGSSNQTPESHLTVTGNASGG